MQKIPSFFKRPIAKLVPIDMVAGNAGGTTMVIKSNARSSIVVLSIPSRIKLMDDSMNPNTAKQKALEDFFCFRSNDCYYVTNDR